MTVSDLVPHKRWPGRAFAPWLTGLAFLGVAQNARAQGAVSAERFQPAPGPRNFLTVETARVDGEMAFSFGLMASYANSPFRLHHCAPGSCDDPGSTRSDVNVIKDLFTANLLASFTPIPRLQIGVRVPIAYAAGDGVDTNRSSASFGNAVPGGVSGGALGDPSLELKVRALGQPSSMLTAGLSGGISAPLGQAISPQLYIGDSTAVGVLRAIVDAKVGRFFFGANVGGATRASATIGTLVLGPEARAGIGAGFNATSDLTVLAESFASSNFTTHSGTNSAEADLAARYALPNQPFRFTLGGGTGLNEGLGAPLFRIFLGVSVELERAKAKKEANPDVDQDGIRNEDDACPLEGGDVVRLRGAYYGCPKRDSDGDGVTDSLDVCPDKPGLPTNNGCPDPDRDHDGIPNEQDQCPEQPENHNGFQDTDGCPDAPPISIEVHTDQIVVINVDINFDSDSGKIIGARSFESLDLVVQALNAHPEIKQLEIAGHTDDKGPRDLNLALSRKRAASVLAYFVSKGIAPGRLISNGYGPDKPVGKNDTEEGRAQNRRVQFNILLMSK